MSSTLPTPLAAALGIVPALLDRARRLPGRAVQLPVLAVSHALGTMDTVRREYDDLAQRGEALVARLRGQDSGQDRGLASGVNSEPSATPTARLNGSPATADLPAVLQDASAAIADISGAPDVPVDLTDTGASSSTASTSTASGSAASTSTGTDTDAGTAPGGVVRHDTAASPGVQEAVEAAVEEVAAAVDPDVEHGELPLPDYDHMTLGSLRGWLRALTIDQLVQIRAYEKSHADRLPVVTMLDNRIAKLSTDPTATPSGAASTSPAPEQLAAASGPARQVSPATTDAPTINPPSQGDPTNPGQPR